MTDLVIGEDRLPRCSWGASTPELQGYHDQEWGRPLGDDDRVFEKLCLEGFQSGLSWLTILRKRDGFRRAFASFDPTVVSGFSDADVDRLLADTGIVRNRAKIRATITNAQATIGLRERGISLAVLLWKHEPGAARPHTSMRVLQAPPQSPRPSPPSCATTAFASSGRPRSTPPMQSLGVVNDHLVGCHFRDIVQSIRTEFTVPR